jgi:hypothetical protein
MPQIAGHVSLRLYPSEAKLALTLAKYHKLAGRGRLLAKYMREDVERIKKTRETKS